MTISASELADMRQEVAEVSEAEAEAIDWSALQSVPQILGYVIAVARKGGMDGMNEVDAVEMFVRLNGMLPDEIRRHERVLRQLGYVAVCDRLGAIVGRRKGSLVPLG